MEEITLPSDSELQKLEKAQRDAVKKAFEDKKIADEKAREAANYARKMLVDAGISKQPAAVLSSASSSESAEGSEEDETKGGKNKQAKKSEKTSGDEEEGVLPSMPASGGSMEKEAKKISLNTLTDMWKTLAAEQQLTAEGVLGMWLRMQELVQAGVGHKEILDRLNTLTHAQQVSLLAHPVPKDFSAWRDQLLPVVRSQVSKEDVEKELSALARQGGETAVAFLKRVQPVVTRAVRLQLAAEDREVRRLWSTTALGVDYYRLNRADFDLIRRRIEGGEIHTVAGLVGAAMEANKGETIPDVAKVGPKPGTSLPAVAEAAPVAAARGGGKAKKSERERCGKCKKMHRGECWHCGVCGQYGHNEVDGNPCDRVRELRQRAALNRAEEKECMPVGGAEVVAIAAHIGGRQVTLGLDTLAGVNLVRRDALPHGVTISPGGPRLHGVGDVQSSGTVRLTVHVGALVFPRVCFAVVDKLPVQALVGKPTLASMQAILDVAKGQARLVRSGKVQIAHAVAVPVQKDSDNSKAQSYWGWLNRRFAGANKRLQVLVEDTLRRADDVTLEKFLATFPDWSLEQRRLSGKDDPNVHPAPIQPELERPAGKATVTGVVVCPILVKAESILRPSDAEELMAEVAEHDDSRDFLPPVMSFEEEDARVEEELQRLVDESEFTAKGRARLRTILMKYRSAFGMQLRQVRADRDEVETTLTGTPEHQPRRRIRDPRVMRAQIQWERAMLERGVIGELTGKAELARPINIHHVIRNGKIRFTADARPLNDVTVVDSFPVPSPMEALDRFRRNKVFSTFDEADSYFQYPYAEGSRVPFYSAEGGIREFRVVIQGGKNSPAALHRFKAKQYQTFSPDELAFMFDDTLLGTDGAEERHLDLLERFLANCAKNGTILKPSKANIGKAEVKHQGFILGHGYYKKDPEAVRALVDMRLPTTGAELKSQLSMLGRYREFVPEYAQLAAPLEAIMDKRWAPETFTRELQERLTEIRRCVAQETMLTMPDWNRPFHWRIDASPTYGWAGVMGQEDDNGKFWPLKFMSKKASEADKKRWPTEMEAMAWYYCLVEKNRTYSQYSENIIHGDPKSLRWLAESIEKGQANRQMQRVALALQAMRITFKYHPREEMHDVDTLSRFAVDRRSSREELEAFLASDKPAVENTLIVATVVPARECPIRKGCCTEKGTKVAVPAGVAGGDSPPGVPVDFAAEQAQDPFCHFVLKVKRGELPRREEQERLLKTLPNKVAAALRYYMETQAKSRDFEEFEVRKGKLYRKDKDNLGYPQLCLVVPWRLRARVLTANHDAPSAGHGGLYKTYGLLSKWYWWFGMYKDAKLWVKSCHCQMGKRRTVAGHGTAKHMGLVPTKYRPFERVVVDLIGPLPESRDRKRHVLVIVDAFSSETSLRLSIHATQKTLQIRCLDEWFWTLDAPNHGKQIRHQN
jgi:hypothetical protein